MGRIINWLDDRIDSLRKNTPIEDNCPRCSSNNIVKIEPCSLCEDRYNCREEQCTKSPYFISSKGFTQVVKCSSCGYEWNISKRV